ncbi:MAG: hypothetical protein GKR96_06440 [Gammaproteobacteria bacterium]|nr:hypothetical protein [Gammaproteobacteria bacterium]
MTKGKLILSIFPGIDLLGKGFEEQGFCVVRSPDHITGGDIRDFVAPSGVFGGVVGGSPCQDFSALNRAPTGYGLAMLNEYKRVVLDNQPSWFLFENVAQFPNFTIKGYTQQRFELDLGWFVEYSRLRHFMFGSLSGALLNPMKGKKHNIKGGAVVGKDSRSFQACCEIQGLSHDFDLPFFSLSGKKQAVANGVPLPLSCYLAKLIQRDYYGEEAGQIRIKAEAEKRCACQCGRLVYGRAKYDGVSCRKRAQRQRSRI